MLLDVLLLTTLLAVAGILVLSLVRGALRHWRAERAGTAYALPVDYRPAALRAAGAVLVTVATLVTALALVSESGARKSAVQAGGLPGPQGARVPASPNPAPPGPTSSGASAPGGTVQELGRPSGGILHGLPRERALIWLPPGYDSPSAADRYFPVVLAHVPDREAAHDMFAAFARRRAEGRGNPFILVIQPRCGVDASRLLEIVDARYRTLRDGDRSGGRAVLGFGPSASCALKEALLHPDRFGSAAALADGDLPPVSAPAQDVGFRLRFLLACTADDRPARTAAQELRDSLARFAETRIVDTVPPGDRRELFAVAADYLTEALDAPRRS